MEGLSEHTIKPCDQCQAVSINGVYCHEIGCPNAWRDTPRECKWCGRMFWPQDKNQFFCDEECRDSYVL